MFKERGESSVGLTLLLFGLMLSCAVTGIMASSGEISAEQISAGAKEPKVTKAEGNWCSVKKLKPYFGPEAAEAACVCAKESSGRPDVIGTLSSREHSVGLFQKNLRDRVDESFMAAGGPVAAELEELIAGYREATSCADAFTGNNPGLLEDCESFFQDPNNNLTYASWYWGVARWKPWSAAAAMCGVK